MGRLKKNPLGGRKEKGNLVEVQNVMLLFTLLLLGFYFSAKLSSFLPDDISFSDYASLQNTVGEKNYTQTSTAVVLKEMIKFAALDLDLDSFDNNELFPPVGVVRDKRFECKKYPLEP